MVNIDLDPYDKEIVARWQSKEFGTEPYMITPTGKKHLEYLVKLRQSRPLVGDEFFAFLSLCAAATGFLRTDSAEGLDNYSTAGHLLSTGLTRPLTEREKVLYGLQGKL